MTEPYGTVIESMGGGDPVRSEGRVRPGAPVLVTVDGNAPSVPQSRSTAVAPAVMDEAGGAALSWRRR